MKYKLMVMCCSCGLKGRAELPGVPGHNGIKLPPKWGFKLWESGHLSLACSQPCADEIEKTQKKHSIIKPPMNFNPQPKVN